MIIFVFQMISTFRNGNWIYIPFYQWNDLIIKINCTSNVINKDKDVFVFHWFFNICISQIDFLIQNQFYIKNEEIA